MRARSAFTLIELMVVVAILAILASLLLPVLNKGKAKSKQIRCASNMRQAIMALSMYLHDNDDTMPPYYRTQMTVDPDTGKRQNQPVFYNTYLEPYIEFWRIAGDPTIQGANWEGVIGAVICTAEEVARRGKLAALFVGGDERSSLNVKTTRVRNSSEALLFTDLRPCMEGFDLISPLEYQFERDDEGNLATPSCYGPAPRVHNGGSNTGLLDGHVEWVHERKLWAVDRNGEVTHPFWYPE